MSSDDLDRKSTLDGALDRADSGLDEKHAGHTVAITSAPLPDGFEDDPANDPAKNSEFADKKRIITGEDASLYLLPIRDDHDPALTFRSIVLATGLSCFQAVMSQIYMVGSTILS